MMQLFRNTYLTNRFFWILGTLVLLFCLGFPIPFLYPLSQFLLSLFVFFLLLDLFFLFDKRVQVKCQRLLPKRLSMGSANPITLSLNNLSGFSLRTTIIEELPVQFQKRDFEIRQFLPAGAVKKLEYQLTPVLRGLYEFGRTNLFVETILGLVQRRLIGAEKDLVPVYPSIIHMREMQLKTLSNLSFQNGIKKVRRLGHSYEFEKIKNLS